MCIYCTTRNYRKIYEHHHGTIPKDEQGRSYHIHHIDGNRLNNNPSNLVAVSIEEHYNIHLSQGDLNACLILSNQLNITGEELSNIARERNRQLVEQGKHPFQQSEFIQQNKERSRQLANKRVQDGTHHFLDKEMATARNLRWSQEGTNPFLNCGDWVRERNLQQVKDGTHPFLNQGAKVRERNNRQLAEGTHPFLDKDMARRRNLKRVEEGTHKFLTMNKEKLICPHCDKSGSYPNMKRWHMDNCKSKP